MLRGTTILIVCSTGGNRTEEVEIGTMCKNYSCNMVRTAVQ